MMTLPDEKAGRGGNPNRTGTSSRFDTKRIPTDRREIKSTRDFEAEKLRLLRLRAGIRFNDLGRLVSYRRRYGLNVGPEFGWAVVLANLSECFGRSADAFAVNDLGRRLGLPQIDEDIAAAACRSADGILMSAVVAGEFLEVSSCERTDAKIRSLEAVDESATDRKRRISRERQRRRRAVVTRPKMNTRRDTARRPGGGLRRFASRLAKGRTSTALTSRQEPQPGSFFVEKEKSQGSTTVEATGVADAHPRSNSAVAEVYGGRSNIVLILDATALFELAAPKPCIIPQRAASPPGDGSHNQERSHSINQIIGGAQCAKTS